MFSTVYHAVLSTLNGDRTRPQAVLQSPKAQDTVTANQTSLTFQDVTAPAPAPQTSSGWKAAPTYRPAPRHSSPAANRPSAPVAPAAKPAAPVRPAAAQQAPAGSPSPFRRVTPLPKDETEKHPRSPTIPPPPQSVRRPRPRRLRPSLSPPPLPHRRRRSPRSAPGPAPQEQQPWLIRGELFRTYVMVEQGDKVVLIDKHAAHERANFDRLKAADYQPMVQELLSPVILHPRPGGPEVLLEPGPLLARFWL